VAGRVERAAGFHFVTIVRRTRPAGPALSNLADIMGRAAVHSGKIITWDEAMASNFQFCPNIDSMTDDTPPPVQANDQGHYPVPIPGVWSRDLIRYKKKGRVFTPGRFHGNNENWL